MYIMTSLNDMAPINAFLEMRHAFNEFDLDNDGHISPEELITALRILGGNPSDKDVELIMASCAKESGYILKYNAI